MNVEKLMGSVYLIDTLFAGMKGVVASYVIKGEKAAIIDTGYPATHENVLNALSSIKIGREGVNFIIPTHIHLDHGGASGHLARELENATVIVHERGAKHLVDPTKLIASVKSIFPEDKLKYMGLPVPIPADKVRGVKGNEEIFDIGGIELRTIYTPGHAPHHMSIYVNDLELIFTGDAVVVKYPNFPVYIPTTPAPSFDPDLAIKSVEKLEKLEAKYLLIPHFGLVQNVDEHLQQTKIKIREWVEKVREITETGEWDLMNVLNEMINYVAEQANVDPRTVPENVKGSIYISVFGILHYLDKQADR